MKNFFKLLSLPNYAKFCRAALITSVVCAGIEKPAQAQGAETILTIPDEFLSSDFVGNGNFNAIIFGNFQSNSGDVEGRLAVAGDFNLTTGGYSVGTGGQGVNAPDDTDNFVINGAFNNTGVGNWGLRGNMIYNTNPSGTTLPSLIVTGTSIKGGVLDHIRFSDNELIDYYRTLSGKLDLLPNTGTLLFDGYHQYTLKGTSLGLNVFDITLPENMSSDEIKVEIPAGSSAIINILNTSLTISSGSMKMNGADQVNGRVLFNFPNANFISLSHFKWLGNFLAPKASLNGNGGSINGQSIIGGHFDQKGGFEFHNFYFEENSISLPVTLVKFAAAKEGKAVNLSWTTSTESNSSHFDIEHSVNGKVWNRIGTVSSNGESKEKIDYTFTDASPFRENLYRLKMVDLDGSFAYSSMQSVTMDIENAISIFPNPVTDKIRFANRADITSVTINDLAGRQVYSANQVQPDGIDCHALKSGMYVVTMHRSNGSSFSQKVLVAK
ncbi:choice-of-anchor A family protein [Dyadobacter fermentans]|uniref:Uncharacterized protein n=1 Tax=Dyadobacter fermentans (strain ATCC 700827 / DSM 18053 / CIP 107007 / KCTC 52180 / NS114) TaxID=471854 RepID=C6VTP5_DYAFD|nr:choice-of-anchor A family protein [Dyadobacter fermentans]ACT92988.1 hypothetical protein Dfer_1747 [Dyadobacter fermentans DSM 18053]